MSQWVVVVNFYSERRRQNPNFFFFFFTQVEIIQLNCFKDCHFNFFFKNIYTVLKKSFICTLIETNSIEIYQRCSLKFLNPKYIHSFVDKSNHYRRCHSKVDESLPLDQRFAGSIWSVITRSKNRVANWCMVGYDIKKIIIYINRKFAVLVDFRNPNSCL